MHTYYVIAGTTPVLVHNSNGSCGIGRQLIGDKSSDHILEVIGTRGLQVRTPSLRLVR
nr:hypothetical protein [Salinispora arenicola]